MYSDLNADSLDNLIEYGQPRSPYQSGYDHEFVPDYSKVVVAMPQREVMTNGYGRNITADTFPLVNRFLTDPLGFPTGSYSFDDLVRLGYAQDNRDRRRSDRWIFTDLYGMGKYNITPGDLSWDTAAYIHGSVSLALMARTKFIYSETVRRVEAEIGAGDDNWDYASANVPEFLNAAVAAVFAPPHYNLTRPIKILFTPPGKRSEVEKRSQPRNRSSGVQTGVHAH